MIKDGIKLQPNDRLLFLTKDLNLIKEQLYNDLNLDFTRISPDDLLDDINTDVMTPAWVCFDHDPREIAKNAYAGLMLNGERVFKDNALKNGNFFGIVSGFRKGTGSSRETAAQCERYSGIRYVFARSFAPIHARNNINLGQWMGDLNLLERLLQGETIPVTDFLKPFDQFSQSIISAGGLFPFLAHAYREQSAISHKKSSYRPMTMAQKIMTKKALRPENEAVFTHQSDVFTVDKGYSHEFTTAQVHQFLIDEFGKDYKIQKPQNFAAFEDHLIYTDEVKKYAPFKDKIATLRLMQKAFIAHNGVKDYSAINQVSPGICHEVAREEMILPGDFVQATDSHTCMGGALNAFAFGVGATEYAAIVQSGLSVVEIPASVNFHLTGQLPSNCSAKDLILFILAHHTRQGLTHNKVMEFTGPGLRTLSIDERATLCNMATECQAKTGICEPDDQLLEWLAPRRPEVSREEISAGFVWPDADCDYSAGRFVMDLAEIRPMVAHPGDPERGVPSDPTNGVLISDLGPVKIDIAYGGSCTAGKMEDMQMYAEVTRYYQSQGQGLAPGVQFIIQYGSRQVHEYCVEEGLDALFRKAGIRIISPGCGACIGCGPGVSETAEQVTISAINRNFQGRSGPGRLYLGSPYTVAASAFAGKIVAWTAPSA